MSRRSPRVPKYCHHKASGQAVVCLSGRDHYLGKHGSRESHRLYERLIAEWLANGGRHGRDGHQAGDLIVNQLLAAYWRWAENYYVKNGRSSRELQGVEYAIKPLVKLYGTLPVNQFSPSKLKTVRQALVDAGYCRPLINHHVNRIRRIFKWGIEEEIVPSSVLEALKAVAPLKKTRTTAPEPAPVQPVAEADINAALAHLPPTVQAMVRLQLLTAMRPGELCLMRGCDIDTTEKVWIYRPSEHKTEHFGHTREVYLGPQAQQVVSPFLRQNLAGLLFSPKQAQAERNAQRSTHRRKPNRVRKTQRKLRDRYDTDSYRRAIAYACDQAGIPRWSPGRLRHNAATNLRREYGLDVAQVILGHRCADITQVYAELDREKAFAVVGRIG